MERKPLVAANWKLNGSVELCEQYATNLDPGSKVDCWVFPTALHVVLLVGYLKEANSKIKVGVQNIFTEVNGAFTGEISANLAQEVGATSVIVGHSERRTYFGETSENVASKTQQGLDFGLDPIVCVGERQEERESGKATYVVEQQLKALENQCSQEVWESITIAYEPVWAIGTGLTATPDQAQDMHAHIRSLVNTWRKGRGSSIRILYGGSVNPSNAGELLQEPDIDGFLVGGASLDVSSFESLLKQAEMVTNA